MKRVVAIAMMAVWGVATSVHAEDTAKTDGTKSTNAATAAQPNGSGGATPAMPGNETAKEKVTANRAKAEANRERAAAHRAEHAGKPEKPEKPSKPEKPEKPGH